MKKHENELLKSLHEEAEYFFSKGIISPGEMKEYDNDCLVQKADTVTPSTGKRSPLVASGAGTHGAK